MAKLSQDELNKLLWNAADSARGVVDAGIFKDYILAFLFFKYISDIKQAEVKKLQERYGDDKERIALRLKNARFVLPDQTSKLPPTPIKTVCGICSFSLEINISCFGAPIATKTTLGSMFFISSFIISS